MSLAVVEPVLESFSFLQALLRLFDLFLKLSFNLALVDVKLRGENTLECLPLGLHELLVVRVHEE